MVKAPAHAVARKDGWALEHRLILFNATGPGAHPCHWCGTPVTWDLRPPAVGALEVDHVDRDTRNNDPLNLVPACHPCNVSASYDHIAAEQGRATVKAGRSEYAIDLSAVAALFDAGERPHAIAARFGVSRIVIQRRLNLLGIAPHQPGRPRVPARPCNVPGCHRMAHTSGICGTHYMRERRARV